MKYKVYFEIYGKKMKTEISANSLNEAKDKIKDKIIFHEINPVLKNDPLNCLKGIFGMK